MSPTRRFHRGLGRTTTLVLALAGLGIGAVPHASGHPLTAPPMTPLFEGGSEKTSGELGTVFVNAVDRMLQEYPSGKKSARENAYSAIIAVWIAACGAGAGNVVGMTGFGAGIGGALGGIGGAAVGSAFAGIGAAPGAAAGAGFGGTAGAGAGLIIGTNVTAAEFIALGVVTMYAVDHIESKYPETAALDLDGRGATTTASHLGYMPSSTRGAWASMAGANAGVAESMFIHLIDTAFTDSMLQIADKWTALPGLTDDQRAKLAAHDHLRPMFARIAYIKRNKRISNTSKSAIPLTQWAKTAQGVLHGDRDSVRDAWVAALGVGEVGFNVGQGKLQLKPGRALRDAGAPQLIEVSLPTLSGSVSVGPAKASMSMVPGSFRATVSRAEAITAGAEAGRIRVKFSVGKSSTLALGSASFEAPGAKGAVTMDLKASGTVNGEVLFKLEGRRLAVAKVTIDGLSADVGIGSLPGPASGLLDGLEQKAAGEVGRVLEQSKVTAAFEGLAKESAEVLASTVDALAATVGMVDIEEIERLRIEAGKVVLDVRGKRIDWPAAPDTKAGLAALKAAQIAAKSKAPPMPAGKGVPAKPLPKG